MRTINRYAACAALMLLHGCGGSGGESGGSGGSAAPVTVPQPATPAPATPAPVTPAPIPTYDIFGDLARSWQMAGAYAEILITQNYVLDGSGNVTDIDLTTVASLNEAAGAMTVNYVGGTNASAQVNFVSPAYAIAFTADDIVQRDDESVAFTQGGADLITRFTASVPASPGQRWSLSARAGYQATHSDHETDATRFLLVGAPTVPSDLPGNGITRYTSRLDSAGVLDNGGGALAGSQTISVNFDSGRFDASYATAQTSWPTGTNRITATLVFGGTVDRATGRISGTVGSSDSALRGTFTGRCYGPRCAEVHIIFAVNGGGWGIAGSVAGVAQ